MKRKKFQDAYKKLQKMNKKLKKQNRTSLRKSSSNKKCRTRIDTSNGTKIDSIDNFYKMCMVVRKSEKRI